VRQDYSEVSQLDPETQRSIDQSKYLLRQISEDSSVPRNIRRAANEAIAVLDRNADSPAVRAQNAIRFLMSQVKIRIAPIMRERRSGMFLVFWNQYVISFRETGNRMQIISPHEWGSDA
jgi:uncharacterized protein (UPF0147 family)